METIDIVRDAVVQGLFEVQIENDILSVFSLEGIFKNE